MANYHVLQTTKKDRAQVAFHIAVPDENNAVAVNLQDAVSQYVSGKDTFSQVTWLEADFASEYAQLQNGEVYEYSIMVQYDANLSNAAKLTVMDAKCTSLVTQIQNEIRDKLEFWGLNRDVT